MILDKLAASAHNRVVRNQARISLEQMQRAARGLNADTGFPFEKALQGPDINFICEIKKASPSQGIIAPDFPYRQIAREYEQAGAAAISVLTEPEYFQGSDEYLAEIQKTVGIPLLRKDFTVDVYQIYEAKTIGASAVLLICTLLDMPIIRDYIAVCDELGLVSAGGSARRRGSRIGAGSRGAHHRGEQPQSQRFHGRHQ